jgi:hypothetical protein
MSNLSIRPPQTGEVSRALRFFQNEQIKPEAQILIAAKSKPVERILGVLAGWAEGEIGRVFLGCLPGTARQETAAALIEEAGRTARAAGLKTLVYGKLLAKGHEPDDLLLENGFEIMRSERFFELAVSVVENRVGNLLERHGLRIPATWHAESIRQQSPDIIFDLIAPYRLMTPKEVRSCWNRGEQGGFDPDLSGILFENGCAFGTFLGRRMGELLCIDIRVVNHPNPRLRALGNLSLFRHSMLKNRESSNPVRWLQFRGGELEHKETANLAKRMGGIELPLRHVLAKPL